MLFNISVDLKPLNDAPFIPATQGKSGDLATFSITKTVNMTYCFPLIIFFSLFLDTSSMNVLG